MLFCSCVLRSFGRCGCLAWGGGGGGGGGVTLFVRLFDLRLFVLSVSSFSWCLGRAAACDCGTPWTFLLPFFGGP